MKKIYILLIILLAIIMVIYGNIAIKTNKSISYINIYLEISNITETKIQENNVYFSSPSNNQIKGSTMIRNDKDKDKKVKIVAEGQLAENNWLEISEDSFKIKTQETKSIEITINIPQEAEGNYSSRLRIESR